jgi:CRISPR system Cascade subunit CasE
MYLSRLELKPQAAQNPSFWAGLQELYGAHQAIWNLFADGPTRKRDFLFRKEGEGAGTRWYALSERAPLDPHGYWTLDSRPFNPRLVSGQRLAFKIRVNPTVAKAVSKTKSVRHDVVMNAKRLATDRKDSIPDSKLIRDSCMEWFQARAARHGFDFDPHEIGVDGYRQLGGRKSKGIRLSTVDIEGILTVREPESFVQMLFKGLGPAKSFGCGLMLIRRA